MTSRNTVVRFANDRTHFTATPDSASNLSVLHEPIPRSIPPKPQPHPRSFAFNPNPNHPSLGATYPVHSQQHSINQSVLHSSTNEKSTASRLPQPSQRVFGSKPVRSVHDGDLLHRPRNSIESRAVEICLSKVPIVQHVAGRTRVARSMQDNNVRSGNKELDLIQPAHFSKSSFTEVEQHQVPILEKECNVASTYKPVSRYFPSAKLEKEAVYEYNPPAAAKYYLWDSTRIGLEYTMHSNSLSPEYIQFEESALHAFKIHSTKIGLLAGNRKQSACEQSSVGLESPTGFMLGRKIWIDSDTESNSSTQYSIVVDRFDAGRQVLSQTGPIGTISPSVVSEADIIIPVYLREQSDGKPIQAGSDRVLQLLKTLKDKHSSTTLNQHHSFPLIAESFFDMSSKQVWLQAIFAIPYVKIDAAQIHPLRIVSTSLSHELFTLECLESPTYGFMSLDQARHLYLLEECDSKSKVLPLIGLWFKSVNTSLVDPYVHAACIQYVLDSSRVKLDTGKSTFLVCIFQRNANSGNTRVMEDQKSSAFRLTSSTQVFKPVVFECTFNVDKSMVKFYQTHGLEIKSAQPCSFSTVDLMNDENTDFCQALESFYQISLRPAKTPSITAAMDHIEDEISEKLSVYGMDASEPDVSSTQETKVQQAHVEDTANIASSIDNAQNNIPTTLTERVCSSAETAPTHVAVDFGTSSCPPELPPLPLPYKYPMFPDGINQMWYLSMLQQQVEIIQSQIVAFSRQPYHISGLHSTAPVGSTLSCNVSQPSNAIDSNLCSAATPSTCIGNHAPQEPQTTSESHKQRSIVQPTDSSCLVQTTFFAKTSMCDAATNTSFYIPQNPPQQNHMSINTGINLVESESNASLDADLNTKAVAHTAESDIDYNNKSLHELDFQRLQINETEKTWPPFDNRENHASFFQCNELASGPAEQKSILANYSTMISTFSGISQGGESFQLYPQPAAAGIIEHELENQKPIHEDTGSLGVTNPKDIIAGLVSDPEQSFVYKDGCDISAISAVDEYASVSFSIDFPSYSHNKAETSVGIPSQVPKEAYSRATLDYLHKYGLMDHDDRSFS
ncbi:hypothetical protein BDV3_002874 [Batrachochytrium dendrobatidis]